MTIDPLITFAEQDFIADKEIRIGGVLICSEM
jgi:hypothetical protein